MTPCKGCGKKFREKKLIDGICGDCLIEKLAELPEKRKRELLVRYAFVPPLKNFSNPFAFQARSGRLDYLLWLSVGILLPWVFLFSLGSLDGLSPNLKGFIIFVPFVLGSTVVIAGTIRRAYDVGMSPWEAVILSVIFPPIPQLYLIFKRGKYTEFDRKETKEGQEQETQGAAQ